METPKPALKITYNGKDITADVTANLIMAEYTDNTEGKSDEISLQLEDVDAKWIGPWYPGKGNTLTMEFGYVDTAMVSAGVFEIDEVEVQGPPDTITIRAIATGIKKAFRTKSSSAFENQTLRQIAQTIATKHGMTITGTIENIKFARITQNQEHDLGFLRRISQEYGHIFSIRGSQLVFTSIYDIEKGKAVVSIDRTEMSSHSIRDKTSQVFKAAQVRYHDPTDKTVKSFRTTTNTNADGVAIDDVTQDDILEIRTKAENQKQAELKARAALYRHNSKQQDGSITVEGNPLLLGGNNIELTGMGALSGKFHIMKSTHSIDKSGGYTTIVEVKRVGYIEKVKQRPKRINTNATYRVIS